MRRTAQEIKNGENRQSNELMLLKQNEMKTIYRVLCAKEIYIKWSQ